MNVMRRFLRWLAWPSSGTDRGNSIEACRDRSIPRDPAAPRSIRVIVGLDYGTHSTKMLLRRRGEGLATVVTVDDPVEGYPPFASPSLVRVGDDGTLTFGGSAARGSGGHLYRYLKVELLKRQGDVSALAPEMTDFLVSAYLAWVIGGIKRHIDARYRGVVRVSLNMAAPMDYIQGEQDGQLRHRYLRIAQAAWESAFGRDPCPVRQGIALRDARMFFAPRLSEGTEIVPREKRSFDVLPETVAPLVSLSLDPQMSGGQYMMIDMGAGTTEISVNRVGLPIGDQRITCYADSSTELGSRRFEVLESDAGCGNPTRLQNLLAEQMRQAWFNGYQKDKDNHCAREAWKEITVLTSGGGTRRKDVEIVVQRAQQWDRRRLLYAFNPTEVRYMVRRHCPKNIDLGDGRTEADDPEMLSFLAVAHGLSIPRMEWPIVFEPASVERLAPSRDAEKVDRSVIYET